MPKTPPYRSRSKKSVLKPLTELNAEERADKLKQQSLTNEYHKFVEGHLILKQGTAYFFFFFRMILLRNFLFSPKLINLLFVDAKVNARFQKIIQLIS